MRILISLPLLWLMTFVSTVLAQQPLAAQPQLSMQRALSAPLRHAIAMHGEPAYPEGFSHFDYLNPDAPKQGLLRRSAIGTFDSLNPYIVKGNPATGLGYLYDTLTQHGEDEPFTEYGLLAERIELPEARNWVRFHLDPRARFHDGEPVTAEDVRFSFKLLLEQGAPFYRAYYGGVDQVIAESPRSVLFTFKAGDNRELPLILGQLPVLPKHYWEGREFNRTSLEIPVGSGPYRITAIDPGRSITYTLDDNYWGRDLPVNRGRYNFRKLIFDYYRDQSVAFEAFKAGEFDLFLENNAKNWATGYHGPAIDSGQIVREEIPNHNPAGMQGFAFNLRREKFRDVRVRQAIGLLFDFEWSNRNLFYGAYSRTTSYFANSELASSGIPQGAELALLAPYRQQLPEALFHEPFKLPQTDGSGNIRPQLRQAMALLRQAGWKLQQGKLVNAAGEPLNIEFLLYSNAFERVVQPFRRNLERLGIASSIRLVDVSQYINRINQFDFDMVVQTFGQSLSPGNEQLSFWGAESADQPGTRNVIGIQDPVVDALVKQVVQARDREGLVTATRALDRVLLWHHYMVPHWYMDRYRVAYRNNMSHPEKMARYSLLLDGWWVESGRE